MFSYERAVDRPRLCAAFALAVTLAFSFGLSSLTVTTNPEKMLNPDDPEVQFYERFRANFPEEIPLSVILTTDNVYQTPILESITRLSVALADLNGVSGVESLKTAQAYSVLERGGVDLRPLLDSIPESAEELRLLREKVESNPFISGTLVNVSGNAAAIHLRIDSQTTARLSDKSLVDAVENILEKERSRSGGAEEIFQIGSAPIKVAESRLVLRDALTLTPIAIVVVLLILILFFRSWIAIILPFSTGLLSIAATLGFMGMMNYPLTPLTSTVPTLLMVLGCTEDIHLLSEYAKGIRKGLSRRMAIRHMASECWKPILLTFLTTLVGFLVLSINGITYLREYAITASFGIFVNFLITVSLTPLLLRLLPLPSSFQQAGLRDRIQRVFVTLYSRHPVAAIALSVIATGIVAIGASRIVVTTDPMTFFFSRDSEIRRNYLKAKERFQGFDLLYVVIETNRHEGVKNPEMLDQIAAFTTQLGERFNGIQSYPEVIQHAHRQFLEYQKGERPAQDLRPEDIAYYTMGIPKRMRERFVDYDASRTVVFVPAGTSNSKEVARLSDGILETANTFFGPDIEVSITGPLANISNVANGLARNLAQDLAFSLTAILLMIGLFFRSSSLCLLTIVPNAIPLIVTFGMMGWMGTPLSLGTYPTALIVIAIAVDDTIHFFARFMKQRARSSSSPEASRETLALEFQPVLCSSLAISAGFLVLAFAECTTIRHSGYLASIALASALIADLVITPALLAKFPGTQTFPGKGS
jgi:predicted RND superfamily exporter protein